MAEKKSQSKPEVGSTVTVKETHSVQIDRPVERNVYLTPGMEFTVIADGERGTPIDDVSRTVWQSWAKKIPKPGK